MAKKKKTPSTSYKKTKVDRKNNEFIVLGLEQADKTLSIFSADYPELVAMFQKSFKEDPIGLKALIAKWAVLASGFANTLEEMLSKHPSLDKKMKAVTKDKTLFTALTMASNAGMFALCSDYLADVLANIQKRDRGESYDPNIISEIEIGSEEDDEEETDIDNEDDDDDDNSGEPIG